MRKLADVFKYDEIRESVVGDAATPDYIACLEPDPCEFDDDVYTADGEQLVNVHTA
jgi:hypothetical protein